MRTRERLRKPHKGFSLIELVVAVAILTTLTGAAVPNVTRLRNEKKQETCFMDRSKIADAYNAELDRVKAYADDGSCKTDIKKAAMAKALEDCGYTDTASLTIKGEEGAVWTIDLKGDDELPEITCSNPAHDQAVTCNDFVWNSEDQGEPAEPEDSDDEIPDEEIPDAGDTVPEAATEDTEPEEPDESPEEPELIIDPEYSEGYAGDKIALRASVLGGGQQTDQSYTWSSADDSFVSVESAGAAASRATATLKKPSDGSITITVEYRYSDAQGTTKTLSASAQIRVLKVDEEGLKIDPSSVKGYPGDQTKLRVITRLEGSPVFELKDPGASKVVKLNRETGEITLLADPDSPAGETRTAEITAYIETEDRGRVYSSNTCIVTVQPVTFRLNPNSLIIRAGDSDPRHLIGKTKIPTGKCYVEWSVENDPLQYVSLSGGNGKTNRLVVSKEAVKAENNVIVRAKLYSNDKQYLAEDTCTVTIVPSDTVYFGEKGVHISYFEYLPLDEDNWQPYKWRTLKWESDDESIVSISADTNSNSTEKGQAGIIEGKGSGVAHVTVTAVDENGNIVKDADGNELKKVFTVTVTPLPVERVVVPGTDIQSVGTEELKTVLNSRMNGTTWSKWYHVGEIGMTNQNFPELYKTVIRDSSSGNLYMLSRRNQNPVYWPDDIATLDEYVAYCKQVKPKENLFIPLQTKTVYSIEKNAFKDEYSSTYGKHILVQDKQYGNYLVDGDTVLTPGYNSTEDKYAYDSEGKKLNNNYSGEYKGLIFYNGSKYFVTDAKISNSLPNVSTGDWPPDPWFQIVSGPQYPDNGNYEFIK